MFVDSSVTRLNGKTYTRHLLRETYREDGKVKHRTLANLTHCKPEEVEAIRLALKYKGDLGRMLASAGESGPELKQGPSVGAVWVLSQLARELGVVAALGSDRQGKLALWQIIARVLDQGSRLSAVRLAGGHAVGAALGMVGFDEDGLYGNLDWLADNQAEIESRLFAQREPASAPDVFLYDVTSTYLEGEHNAFAAFGYNRDRKSGKRQIVIGLLADADGRPLSIEVFKGNTSDVKTFSSQVNKAAARFRAERVTFVGDRGMIKAPQRAEITAAGFHYITAITKAQIDGLIAAGVLQMDLFEDTLAEVEGLDGGRYVVRRNPARAEVLAASRADKLTTLQTAAETANAYLNEHPRAAAKTQLARLKAKSETLGLDKVVQVAGSGASSSRWTRPHWPRRRASTAATRYAPICRRPSSAKRSCTTATRTLPRSNGRSATPNPCNSRCGRSFCATRTARAATPSSSCWPISWCTPCASAGATST